jgi:hypothetical protein
MSNIFNARRFGMLFIKHSTEHYKTYLMASGVLIGVMLLGGGFIIYLIETPIDLNMQSVLFMPIYFLAGTIFTSTIFGDISDRKKAIASLTLPASHFEKFLVAWLFSYLIFSVVFMGSYYLILMLLLNLRHWPNQHIEVFSIFHQPAASFLLLFTLLQSIAFYGAIVFEKLHFIKTGFCFFIAVGVLTLFNTSFIEALIGRVIRPATPFAVIGFLDHDRYVVVASIAQTDGLVGWLILCVSILFWIAAYYRLKEKQV